LSKLSASPHLVRRRPLLIAVLVSLAVLFAAAWLRGGIGATPYETVDSHGQKMGFNYVPSAEHYGIILKNAGLSQAIEQMEPHDWLLAAMHVVFVLLLLLKTGPHLLKPFLWAQGAIFYWGWAGLLGTPLWMADVLFLHTSDREGFVDIPYISVVGQGAWMWACFFMLWKLRKRRLASRRWIAASPIAA
jgi:hypothetical protein